MTSACFSSKHSVRKIAMPEPDLRRQIKEMLVRNLMLQTTADQIADDLPLFGPGGLGLDSVDALQLVVALDNHYGVKITDTEVARSVLSNVASIAEAIATHRSKGTP